MNERLNFLYFLHLERKLKHLSWKRNEALEQNIPTRKSTFSKYIEVPEHDQVTLMGFLNHGTKPPPHKSRDILNQAVFEIKTIPYINVSIWHDASLLSALFDAFIGFHCYFILIFWFNICHELIIHINVIIDWMW